MLNMEDLYYTPIYFIVLLFIGFFVRSFMVDHKSPMKKYFMYGLVVKLIGAIGVGVVYYFFYGGGDTTEYYNNSLVYYGAFQDSPEKWWQLMQKENGYVDPRLQDYYVWFYFHKDPSAWFFGKICGFFTLFAFKIYTPLAMIMAFVGYAGVWALYKTFYKIYPQLYKEFAIAVLFIPSVFFWGSGMLKDSLTFSCVGWIVYSSYNIFFNGRKIILNSIIIFIFTYICLELKAYIIVSLSPAIILWIMFYYRNKINSSFLRSVFMPMTLAISLGAGLIVVERLGSQFKTYSIDGALSTAESFQEWHGYLDESGQASGYSLGYMDGSALNIISKIPLAINVTLFRPYLWETRNPVMFISAIESTILMWITINLLWQIGIGGFFKQLFNNPTALFCIFFSLFFAFCVGFTAYNFGALVRYKVPCIPFYVAGMYMLYYETAGIRAEKKRKKTMKEILEKKVEIQKQ